jgi:hypothetical protein
MKTLSLLSMAAVLTMLGGCAGVVHDSGAVLAEDAIVPVDVVHVDEFERFHDFRHPFEERDRMLDRRLREDHEHDLARDHKEPGRDFAKLPEHGPEKHPAAKPAKAEKKK